MSRSCVPALPSTQPPPCMYKITGSVPSAPAGLTIRTRTSPTSAGTVIHCSSTGSLSIGAAWTSSSTLRASSGVISYRNGGLAGAATNACDAGSRTTGVYVGVAVMGAGPSGPPRLRRLRPRAHAAVCPVERTVGDRFPAGRACGEVRASGELLVLDLGLRLAEPLRGLPTHRGRDRVVLIVAHDEERRTVVLVEVDLGHGVRIEVGERRLEDHAPGRGHVVALVGGVRVRVAHRVREREMELLGRQRDGPLPVRRVAQAREDGAQKRRRQAQHALHRCRRQGDSGRTEAAVEQQLSHQPAGGVPHDHGWRAEAADDPVIVVNDLRDPEPVHDGWVATKGLDLALHVRPCRCEDLVAALLEARLPAFPAARGEPEAVDEDDGRVHDRAPWRWRWWAGDIAR